MYSTHLQVWLNSDFTNENTTRNEFQNEQTIDVKPCNFLNFIVKESHA